MKILAIDLETYSDVNLEDSGVYRYVEAPSFEILLLAFAFDDEPVQVIDLKNGENIPENVVSALVDPLIQKSAYNANFEKTCLARHLGREMPPEQWACNAVHALTLGLPSNLAAVSKTLNLVEGKAKMDTGSALIRYFCIPCKPSRVNGGRTRNLPEHDPEKWAMFKEYCARDVEAERAIRNKLDRFPVSAEEQRLWVLDQRINDHGIKVDSILVNNAIICDARNTIKLMDEATWVTGLDNPNSISQIKGWLEDKTGMRIISLNQKSIANLLRQTTDSGVRRMLQLRQEMAKTSVKKYEAMAQTSCDDGRIRGLLKFYGANRTGRWAGRLVQVQNLPQNKMKDLDLARQLLREGDYDTLELLFGNLSNVLSQLIRTAFTPAEGMRFIVADFSAIEARVIAWLAKEQWRMDVFAGHGKIYEASASQMFNVPIESINKASPLRQKGKVAELALGYGGGVQALLKMGALEMGLAEDELPELINKWRSANVNIVKLWRSIEKAALEAVEDRTFVPLSRGMAFWLEAGILFLRLPSGRQLAYARPCIEKDAYGRPRLTYEGSLTQTNQRGRIDTYGGKLVENIVQAIALRLLYSGLMKATTKP